MRSTRERLRFFLQKAVRLQYTTWLRSSFLLSIYANTNLLVQGLGVGGSGGNVSVTGGLVGAGGLLQSGGSGEVNTASGVVGLSVASDEVENKSGEHGDVA